MTSGLETSAPSVTLPPATPAAIEALCSDPQVVEIPKLVFPGGASLQMVPDPLQVPSACRVMADTAQIIQPVLAAIQPILAILDLLAQVVQCFLVLVEVVSNPLKIGKLMALFPGLTSALNRLLSYIPILPQGQVTWLTLVYNVLITVKSGIDCAVIALRSLDAEVTSLNVLIQEANAAEDQLTKEQYRQLIGCAQKNLEVQKSIIADGLAPIARILCVVKSILTLIPGGAEVAKQLVVPDIREINVIDEAATSLVGVSIIIQAVADVLATLAAPFGGLLQPDAAFTCAFDSALFAPEQDTEVETPELTSITLAGTVLPAITSLPIDSPDTQVWIFGKEFNSAQSKIYLDTVELQGARFDDRGFIEVILPADLLTIERDAQVLIVNTPPGGVPPFGGLDGEIPSKASNQLALEIS